MALTTFTPWVLESAGDGSSRARHAAGVSMRGGQASARAFSMSRLTFSAFGLSSASRAFAR